MLLSAAAAVGVVGADHHAFDVGVNACVRRYRRTGQAQAEQAAGGHRGREWVAHGNSSWLV